MTLRITHIRGANLTTTAWTTLAQARTALNGPGYDNALMQDLYTTQANANDTGTLTGLLRLTHDHRVYLYYVADGAAQQLEFILGFA